MTAREIPSPYTDLGNRMGGRGPNQSLDGVVEPAAAPAPVAADDSDDDDGAITPETEPEAANGPDEAPAVAPA